HAEECVLHGVFCRRPLSGYPVCDRKSHRLVALVQLLECDQLASGESVDETPVDLVRCLISATYSRRHVSWLTAGRDRAHDGECRGAEIARQAAIDPSAAALRIRSEC